MKNQKFDTKTIMGIVVGILIVFLIKQFIFTTPSFDKVLMKTASELNESCPIMIDQDTRLDNTIAFPDKVFQYNYTLINYYKDSINVIEFENIMKSHIIKNIITNPDMKTFRENKVTMSYYYLDRNGDFIKKIIITPQDYMEKLNGNH